MPLPHGREISADEIELTVSREFPIRRFVSLCNSLLWATSKSEQLTQVSVTERVFVKDNGIDAEWTADLGGDVPQGALVRGGWNVFQYKQRDVTAASRRQIIAALIRELRESAQEVVDRTGKYPDHYSLFTNIHLTHADKEELERSIRHGFERELIVTVHGAAALAVVVNDLPHIRAAFFSTTQFATWNVGWENHNKTSISGKVPKLVGNHQVGAEIRRAIDDAAIRVVVVTGAPSIGKSRLALEATAHRPIDTVIALDASVSVADLLQMRSSGQHPLIIVDNPDEKRTEELIPTALAEELKLVFTVTDPSAAQLFNFGIDPRIKVFPLQPLVETGSRELLQGAGARLDYSVESWILEKAGGNPGILIAAAAVGMEIRVGGAAFLEQVGERLEARARAILGEQGLRAIRVLSVMSAVGAT